VVEPQSPPASSVDRVGPPVNGGSALSSDLHATLGREDQPYPASLRAWWLVGVLCLAALVSYTDRLILSALVDPIKHSLGVGDSAVGLLQGAAFALVYVFSGLLLGRLVDQRRRRTILVFGSTLWCLGTVACGLAPSFGPLFVARIAVGIGEAALAPAAVSMIADSFAPARRGTAVGLFMVGFFIGGPASIAIGGVLLSMAQAGTFALIPAIGALEAWRAVLVITGLAGLAVPGLFLTLVEPARRATEPVLPLRAMVRRLGSFRRSVGPLYLAMGMLSIGDYGVLAWMPSALSRRFALPPAEVGTTFGAVTVIAGILGCLLGGVLSDAAARWRGTSGRLVLALAVAVLASGASVLICSAHLAAAVAGLGLWTFCSGLGAISGLAAVQNLVPGEYRGVGIALVAFCNTLLGLGFGPSIVAAITDHIYRDPTAVGLAITTAALPTGVVAALLFWAASRAAAAGHPG
jgi:MFS family permease